MSIVGPFGILKHPSEYIFFEKWTDFKEIEPTSVPKVQTIQIIIQ